MSRSNVPKRKAAHKRMPEYQILRRYCRGCDDGIITREVSVEDKQEPRRNRKIDAVCVVLPGRKPRTIKFRKEEFGKLIADAKRRGAPVTVIEAKTRLNRSVIGQAIVAKWLLKRNYAVRPRMIILQRRAQGLKEFCEEHQIDVRPPWLTNRDC